MRTRSQTKTEASTSTSNQGKGRNTTGVDASNLSTTSKAAARYFTKVLDNANANMQKLCDQWTLHRSETIADEETCNMIDGTVGHAYVLINHKFGQFRTLLGKSKISCEDLQQSWDVLSVQVDNVQTKFNNLATLKNTRTMTLRPRRSQRLNVTAQVNKSILKKKPGNKSFLNKSVRFAEDIENVVKLRRSERQIRTKLL